MSPTQDSTRGVFIVFEGLDGAGTTTQTSLLADWLRQRGVHIEVTREPSEGPIGALLRQAIDGSIELAHRTLALAFAVPWSVAIRTRINMLSTAGPGGSATGRRQHSLACVPRPRRRQ